MRDTFSFICRARTLSRVDNIYYDRSEIQWFREPNELRLDKFAFVGFVALLRPPRNTVNLTPRTNRGYELWRIRIRLFFHFTSLPLARPFLLRSFSAIHRIPRILRVVGRILSMGFSWYITERTYHTVPRRVFSRDGNVARQKRKHCHAVW